MSVGHYAGWGDPSVVKTSCFSTDVWDPFYPFPTIQSEALADAAFKWKESPEFHLLTARLPGVRKEEVRVEVESGGVLKVSGKRVEERKEGWVVEKSCAREFLRRFRLPENAVAEELSAAMKDDGVLTVTVPKSECKKVKIVQIV